MSSNNPEQLIPHEFRPPDETDSTTSGTPERGAERILWVVVVVVFTLMSLWLINTVLAPTGAPELAPAQLPADVADDATESASSAPAPFEQAREQQARAQAQQILSSLLDQTAWLESARVESWASGEYRQLSQMAAEGDLLYEQREYDAALDIWRVALANTEQLVATAPRMAQEYRQTARHQLDAGRQLEAVEVIGIALAIAPDSAESQQLSRQIQLRPELQAQVADARELLEQRQFQEAVNRLQEVVARDPGFSRAQALLEQALAERDQTAFATALADALFAIEERRFGEAESALDRAARYQPQSAALVDARLQLESARHDARVIEARQQAILAEGDERWLDAVEVWQQVADLSPGSTDARVGSIRAQARADLDAALEATLAQPFALRDQDVWKAAESLLAEARSVREPGDRLLNQIDQLALVIQRARTPVKLVVRSDGATDLRINGVGRIGETREIEVELYPGRYTLTGSRPGYRDVLEQVTIDGDRERVEVFVAAQESVGQP